MEESLEPGEFLIDDGEGTSYVWCPGPVDREDYEPVILRYDSWMNLLRRLFSLMAIADCKKCKCTMVTSMPPGVYFSDCYKNLFEPTRDYRLVLNSPYSTYVRKKLKEYSHLIDLPFGYSGYCVRCLPQQIGNMDVSAIYLSPHLSINSDLNSKDVEYHI